MKSADVGGCNSADEERFRLMHEQNYPDVLRFVERRVSSSEAEDVVSTVFVTAWRRLRDVPPDARPWLFGVARNTMANHTRGVYRRRALDVRVALTPEGFEPDHSDSVGHRIDLARAWQLLSASDRETLALVAFDGLDTEQAAAVLGCRRSAFTMRLSRARRRFQAALDAAGPQVSGTSPTGPATDRVSRMPSPAMPASPVMTATTAMTPDNKEHMR